MSRKTETTLSLLLKLNAGLLDESHAQALRRKIDTNPRWRQRWLKLRELGFDSEDSLVEQHAANVDPQIIAEFVEQQLPEETAQRLEKIAWQNPKTLREIVIAFEYANLPADISNWNHQESVALPARVVKSLGPRPLNGHPYGLVSSDIQASGQKANEDSTETVSIWRYRATWVAAIAASLLLLAAIVFSMTDFSSRVDPDLVEGPVKDQLAPDIAENPPVRGAYPPEKDEAPPIAVNDDGSHESADPPQFDLVAENEADRVVPDERRHEPLIVESNKNENGANEPTAENSQPYRNRRPEYSPIRPQWNRFSGAIGLKEPGQNFIRGYGYVKELTPDMEIHVLSMSWATAAVTELGRLVVDGNSAFKIGSRQHNPEGEMPHQQIEILLAYGRLAIVGMSPDTRVLLKTGDAEWLVTVAEKDTTLVAENTAGRSRLYVRQGELKVRGTDLLDNHHIVAKGGSYSGPERASADTKWVEAPEQDSILPDQLKEQLYNSDNLSRVLAQLQNSADGSTRTAAMRWQWTMHPIAVVKVFRSHDMSNWVEAMNWLVEQSPENPRTRVIWRNLAESPGNPEVAREFIRWVGLRANEKLPTPAQLKQMVSFLASERLFVRFVATYLLENSFGNPPGFSPTAPANVRIRVMHVWHEYIAEVYSRKVAAALLKKQAFAPDQR